MSTQKKALKPRNRAERDGKAKPVLTNAPLSQQGKGQGHPRRRQESVHRGKHAAAGRTHHNS